MQQEISAYNKHNIKCVRERSKEMNTGVYTNRLEVWHDTVAQCTPGGKYANIPIQKSIKISPNVMDSIEMKPKFQDTAVYVLQMDTADAAMDLVRKGYKPLLLNMSDIRTAGGGVRSGSVAQEENLFRRSNYFKTLVQDFYPLTDRTVVYSPQVMFFKDNESYHYKKLEKIVFVDCIACPAIRNPGIREENGKYFFSEPGDREAMKEQARMIFKVGYHYNHDVLILSAHGCGAWGGPTHEIAAIYKELVDEYQGCFRNIVFAILGNKVLAGLPVSNLDIFKETLL